MLSYDRIEKNYKVFVSLLDHLGDRAEPVRTMVEHFGERLVLCPASSKKKFHAAYPGGLVDHSLRVLTNAKKLNDTFSLGLAHDSLIISSLFHDWGKIGDLDNDYYLPQTNSWRRENLGEEYVINYDIQKMPNAERGLWIIQYFGINLSLDEWIAIRCNDGPVVDENKYYAMSEPNLALIIHQADRLACMQEKEKEKEKE